MKKLKKKRIEGNIGRKRGEESRVKLGRSKMKRKEMKIQELERKV